jgi:transcriptional regulator with XRE-family HTH domain
MADRFRMLRNVKGMDVKAFSEFTGLTTKQITNFESNRQFSTKSDPKIDKVARLCGVQPVWLYAGSDVPRRFWPVWWNPEPGKPFDERASSEKQA